MRDADLVKQVEYNGDNVSILAIKDPPLFDIEDYDLFDTKEFGMYIKSIEKICRGSYEYSHMVKYMREYMDMNKCSFYQNVNNIDTFKIKIHIHHEPFSLFDIVNIVYNKRVAHNELLDEEAVAKEVMFLHYNLLVGLIPLAETPHELVHNNYLFIPLNKVMGKVKDFISLYEDYFSPEILDKLERDIDFTKSYNDELDCGILTKKYIYIDMTGNYELPKYEEIIQLMDQRMKELKSKKNFINPLIFKNR